MRRHPIDKSKTATRDWDPLRHNQAVAYTQHMRRLYGRVRVRVRPADIGKRYWMWGRA